MQDNDLKEIWQEELNIFSGILFNNLQFAEGAKACISYAFDCEEFDILKKRYELQNIAGNGSPFERAIRLTRYFAPCLTHKGDFNNTISCNAIDLLNYSLNKPSCGINCINKSKILHECCLALGIYARRVCIMPYSPYDMDNHVVTEIFDDTLCKWIMLDMTSNGYFVDEAGSPLSVVEMRKKFAMNEPCNFVKTVSKHDKEFSCPEMETVYYNRYFAKNSFYYFVEQNNKFGTDGKFLLFVPNGFSESNWLKQNLKYKLKSFPENEALIRRLKNFDESKQLPSDISVIISKPL